MSGSFTVRNYRSSDTEIFLKLLREEENPNRVAEKFFHENGKGRAIAVISGEDRLNEANKKLEDDPLELHRI